MHVYGKKLDRTRTMDTTEKKLAIQEPFTYESYHYTIKIYFFFNETESKEHAHKHHHQTEDLPLVELLL